VCRFQIHLGEKNSAKKTILFKICQSSVIKFIAVHETRKLLSDNKLRGQQKSTAKRFCKYLFLCKLQKPYFADIYIKPPIFNHGFAVF